MKYRHFVIGENLKQGVFFCPFGRQPTFRRGPCAFKKAGNSNTTKVKNIKKYLLATLFNAPSTIKGYYQAEVNHDFPQYAARR